MFLAIFLLAVLIHSNPQVHCEKSKESLHLKKFAPCKACRVFVDSFKKGMDKTASGKFEGGDTAWEEENLGSYANSEIRLTEIQENICSEIEEGKDQCYSIHEEHDSVLEEWWFQTNRNEHDLFQFFCIEKLKFCCHPNHYGENCTPCVGYPDNICSNNGKCKGAGTRSGTGKCLCNKGYSGVNCNECAEGYFELYRDEKTLNCSQCHLSCDGACTKAGHEGCLKCKKGWLLQNQGCVDVNECAFTEPVCGVKQFCKNNEGSYDCINCDHSCKSCTGFGSEGCSECADGFIMRNHKCIDEKEETFMQFFNKYVLYAAAVAGLFVLCKKTPLIGACFIMSIAIYFKIYPNWYNSEDVTKHQSS